MIKSNSFKTEVAFANIPTFPEYNLKEVGKRKAHDGLSHITFECMVYSSEVKDGKIVVFGQEVRETFVSDKDVNWVKLNDYKKRFFEKCAMCLHFLKHDPNTRIPHGEWPLQETLGEMEIPQYMKDLKPE